MKKNKTTNVKAEKLKKFPIVGIGASAGGLEAIETFFKNMPSETGIAFIIIQHLSLDKKSMMSELLQKYTAMKIIEITNNIKISPNTIYLAPANKETAISNGKLCLMDPVIIRHGLRLPIDYFFHSLSLEMTEHSIAVILSGTGSDGTLGIQKIKDAGGMVMVQDIKSAKYDGMPQSAIATNLVDYVLPAEKIPEQLLKYITHIYLNKKKYIENDIPKNTGCLENIFVLLKNNTFCDFSNYKKNTLLRRINKRMAIHDIDDMSIYLTYLQKNKKEIHLLFKELLIPVTSFFRDDEVFDLLKQKIFPKIFDHKVKSSPIRIWVPACSTGEEAYSIAIILEEYMEETNQRLKVQIFATDLNNEVIQKARNGIYNSGIEVNVSPERLKRFFMLEEHNYRVKKVIRDKIIFSSQNMISDPPFSKLDLLSCRNLLIYLDANFQKKLIRLMHYTLNPEGFLLLGPSESIGQFSDLFSVVEKKWKIFSRKGAVNAIRHNYDFSINHNDTGIKKNENYNNILSKADYIEIINNSLLKRFKFPCVIIDEKLNVLYFYGKTGKYLEPAAGEAKLNILDMAREGLKSQLIIAIRRASKENTEVVCENLQVRENGGFNNITLIVKPISEQDFFYGTMIIIFEEIKNSAVAITSKQKSETNKKINNHAKQLEEELKSTKEHLQTTIEELETTNEELNSANEELQSSNEELQSTNEELETSKEELQSVNEELTTVNAELSSKIEDLTQNNNDMNNLLASINIATIFLDSEFRIKRFTPEITKIINIIKEDIGRPIAHFVSNLKYEHFQEDLESVMNNLIYKELEVQTKDNSWYLMKIMPYRTIQNFIDGLVVTFVNISEIKQISRLASVVNNSYDAITVLDLDGNIVEWNKGAEKMYGISEKKAIGLNIASFIPEERKTEMINIIKKIINGEAIKVFETKRITFDKRIIDVMITITPIIDRTGQIMFIATTEHDMTKHKILEEQLSNENKKLIARINELTKS